MGRIKVDTEQLKGLFATHDNESIAQRFGVTTERIRQLRSELGGPPQPRARRTTEYSTITRSEDFQAALGTETDAQTAKRFGVPVNVVHNARVYAKIPSYSESRRNEMIPLLGKVPDRELAAKYGYSLNGVVSLRERLQIAAPANNGSVGARKKRDVTPVAAAPAKTTEGRDVELAPPPNDDVLTFLRTRHKAGDSTEALAARLEMPEAAVKRALGIA